jgi:hypothetical protein
MAQFIGRTNVQQYQAEVKEMDLTTEQLRKLLAKITRARFVKLTGPPYRIKYHTDFLKEFYIPTGTEQTRSQSQEISEPTIQNQSELDDDSTVIPPSVIQTPRQSEPNVKKPRTHEPMEQTTLTQQWTPRKPQILDFDTAAKATQEEDEEDLMEIEKERRRKLEMVVNPYSQSKQKRTPMVTPQKITTHTKKKPGLSMKTNLKDPAIYSPLTATQLNPDRDPTKELKAIVHDTERILDAATAAFHEVNKDDEPPVTTGTIIEGLGTLQPTEASNKTMHSLIQYMDALNAKYCRWIQEYDENEANHKEAFKATLASLTRNQEIQVRKNMEHIITTLSSDAEKKMQRQLTSLVKPHTKEMVDNILKQLDRRFETYTSGLETKYFEKESELISDLDTYYNKAGEFLNEVMEDFYTITVPYTVPPKLTEYIDKHLDSRVTSMITAKMATILDHQAAIKIQQQVDQVLQERMTQYESDRKKHSVEELDRITTLTEQNLQHLTAATTASTQLLEAKRDASIQSIEITPQTTVDTIATLQTEAVTSITNKLQEALQLMLDHKQLLQQNIEDTTTMALACLESKSNEIRQQLKDDMGMSQEVLIDGIHEDIEIAKEGGKMEITDSIQELKRDLQGDKDRHLHSMIQERTRIVQQITDQAEEEKHRIKVYADGILANLQGTNLAATNQPTEPTLRHGTPPNNQWRAGPTQWTPENQSQTSTRTMSQTQYPATQNNDILQQPSEDTEASTGNKVPNRFQERVQQRDQEIKDQQIRERSDRIFDKIHTFKKAQLDYIVTDVNPSQEEIEMLYRNIASEIRACLMPIIPFEELTSTSGTKPTNEPLTPHLEFIVGKELYLLLTKALPRTNKDIKAIMDSYSQTEDGYGALTLIMKTYCPYLKTLQVTWGPTWQPHQTGLEYVASLKRYIGNTTRTSNTQYSVRTIAIELLQQAKQHARYHNIATHYLTRLTLQSPNIPLGTEYEMTHLAGEMDTNRSTELYQNPTVQKMRTDKDGETKEGSNRREGKFKYKREVQCRCCHNFGHDINKQICLIGAQVFHAHQFLLNNPVKAQENAQSYSMSNSKPQIKMARTAQPHASDDKIQEQPALTMVWHMQHTVLTPATQQDTITLTPAQQEE